MEKKELGVEQYVTTGTMFIRGEFKPEKKKLVLSEQRKEAILEYLKESEEFRKLICDIIGVQRKQEKVSPELEKLKEDYLHMCENYEHEKQKRNDFIRLYKEENAKRLEVERERDCAQRHHKFVMDELSSMLKEVECFSVRGIVDELKEGRANGKLFAEQRELLKKENDKLVERCNRLEKNYYCEQKEAREIEKSRDNLADNYDRLAKDYNCLNTRYNNQKEYIAKYIEENKRLIDKVEKLKGKLDRASKRYGELIKIIRYRAIKSI